MPCITRNQALDRMNKLYDTGAIDWMKLQPKIKDAKNIIQTALDENNNPVVAFSGGKDSIVVLDLVRNVKHNTIGAFCNTGNEYPETIEFVKGVENVVWLNPIKSFWQCVKEYGMQLFIPCAGAEPTQ